MGVGAEPHRWDAVALGLLAISAAAIAAAPLAVADDYSWLTETTSESGAQGVSGAWVVRAGFLAFAAAVARLTWSGHDHWGRWGVRGNVVVAISMVAAATFGTRPWRLDDAYDPVEHALHLLASIGVGVGFAMVVVALAGRTWRAQRQVPPDLIVVATIGLVAWPMMAVMPEARGLFQRTMWAVAIGWYALRASGARSAHPWLAQSDSPAGGA